MTSVTTRRQAGMTLLEILLAMTIGLFLIGTVIQIYLSAKQSFRTTEALARVQENGRFAMEELSFDLRMTGYQGCADSAEAGIVRLQGYETTTSGWAPAELSAIASSAVSGSDVVLVQRATGGVDLTDAAATVVRAAGNPDGVTGGDTVVVAGCNGAAETTVSAVSVSGGVISFGLADDVSNRLLGPSLRLMPAESIAYFVDADGLSRLTGGGVEPVIEGVENMQLLYGRCNGCDTAGAAPLISYLPADQIDFDNDTVVSVRVGLLVGSTAQAGDADDTLTYTVAGTAIGPAGSGTAVTHPRDRRLRRVFTTTVNLRNLD